MSRTITPKAVNDGEGFKVDGTEGKKGFSKGECRVDDKMECYYRNPGFLMEPLEVVLRSHLNRSGFCEREMGSGAIEGTMVKLAV